MKLSNFKEEIEKIKNNDRLILLHREKGYHIITLFLNENGDLCEYQNSFYSRVIESLDDYGQEWLEKYRLDEIEVIYMPYNAWCLYMNTLNMKDFFENVTSNEKTNAKLILDEIKKDQGKYVDFKHDDNYKGILVTFL